MRIFLAVTAQAQAILVCLGVIDWMARKLTGPPVRSVLAGISSFRRCHSSSSPPRWR